MRSFRNPGSTGDSSLLRCVQHVHDLLDHSFVSSPLFLWYSFRQVSAKQLG